MSARCGIALLAIVLCTTAAQASATTTVASQPVAASGAPDGHTPGWTIRSVAPPGWTADCCTYARAIGVNAVLYQGDWSGEPNRVMVLNVWPRELPSLDAEQRADTKHFLARDPAAKVGSFPVRHRTMQCAATVFQGTDHVDDVVVFCDPGKASGIRLSWSLSFADGDPTRRALLDAFMRVVVNTSYSKATATQTSRNSPTASFPRKREALYQQRSWSSTLPFATVTWIPAFAGMTNKKLSPLPSSKPAARPSGDVGLR